MSQNQRKQSCLVVTLVAILSLLSSASLPAMVHSRVQGSTSVNRATQTDTNRSPNEPIRARARSAYAQLPMRFENNEGQFDAQVKYAARGAGYAFWLTGEQAVMMLGDGRNAADTIAQSSTGELKQQEPVHKEGAAVIRMKLVGANRNAITSGEDKLPGRSNYFIGNDPRNWHTDVSGYSRVVCKRVYRGVDLVYYGNGRELEYDFKVAPEANPAMIGIRYEGARKLSIDAAGDLVIATTGGELRQRRPLAYQETAGERRSVAARYVLRGANQVSMKLGAYDHKRPLVIDPVIAYSTYLGSSGSDDISGIAVDSLGNAYVTGHTSSTTFPSTGTIGGTNRPMFVSKLKPDGSGLIYSTLVSGFPGNFPGTTSGLAIAIDKNGNAYVTGQTDSASFPTTAGAFQPAVNGGNDAFALKLTADGSSLAYSTCLGGMNEDTGRGIAVDAVGCAYITGLTQSPDFPTANPIQIGLSGFQDGFVSKLNETGTALVYSTFLGGRERETGSGIAVDASGNTYVTGGTSSDDFPTANALQSSFQGRGAFSSSDGGASWGALSNSFPFTTSVNALALDPLNSSVIYAGTDDRGLYKSTNGGSSWIAINNGIPDFTSQGFPGLYTPVRDLEIDRNNPMTLFAGTYLKGLFKSTDGGSSWTPKGFLIVSSVKIDPTNSAIVYFADSIRGLMRSTDGGETWDDYTTISPINRFQAVAVAPTMPPTIYAGTSQGGIFVFHGSPAAANQALLGKVINVIAVDPANPTTAYAGTGSGMFKTTNSGDTWTAINEGMLYHGFLLPYVLSVAVDPLSPNTIYAGTTGFVFKSTDGGATWAQQAGLPVAFVNDIAIDANATSHLFAATNIVDDMFVSKLSGNGSVLSYSTYVGGLDADDGLGIAVDQSRNIYVTGYSYSTSIQGVTSILPRQGISDAFAMKLGATGILSYFTYIGGSDAEQGTSIAIDSAGNSYVVGNTSSNDFPTTTEAIPVPGGACSFCTHGFVTKLNPTGSTLLFSSYLGGNPASNSVGAFQDIANTVAVDSSGAFYVAGHTFADNFPVTAGAFDTSYNTVGDGFALKLNFPAFSLDAFSKSFSGNTAGDGSVNVTGPSGPAWTAASNDNWIHVTDPGPGTGNGSVTFTVDVNPSATANRTGSLTIAQQTFTVYQGAAFLDVPPGHLFYDDIGRLSAHGITVGCGGGDYCPNDLVTREQMAAFIIRSLGEFNPSMPASQRFTDVPPSNPFYNFIDRMAALQITLGCTPDHLQYCPSNPVLRQEMAAFLLRALGEFSPPTPASQRFNDVPPGNLFYNFIDRAAVLNITLGCTPDHQLYCPADPVTRAQMAAFLVRAFNL
jgi:hypothetical protein